MTVLSTIVGYALPHLLPKVLTHWLSILLLLYFSGKMLMEARHMYLTGEGKGVSEELVEEELKDKGLVAGGEEAPAPEKNACRKQHFRRDAVAQRQRIRLGGTGITQPFGGNEH